MKKKLLLTVFLLINAVGAKAQMPTQLVFDLKNLKEATKTIRQLEDQLDRAMAHYRKMKTQADNILATKKKVEGHYNIAKRAFDDLRKVNSFHDTYYAAKDILRGVKSIAEDLDKIYSKYYNSPYIGAESKKQLRELKDNPDWDLNRVLEDYEKVYKSEGDGAIALSDFDRLQVASEMKKKTDNIKTKSTFLTSLLEQEKTRNIAAKEIKDFTIAVVSGDAVKQYFKGAKVQAMAIAKTSVKYLGIIYLLSFTVCVSWRLISASNRGVEFLIKPFYRPLLLGVFLFAYSFCMGVIELTIISPMQASTANLPGGPIDTINKLADLIKTPMVSNDNNSSWNIMQMASDAITSTLAFIYGQVQLLIVSILLLMVSLLSLVPNLIVQVLIILGPFAITLSMLPVFQNAVSQWLKSLISVSLWAPIGNILIALAGQMISLFFISGEEGSATFLSWVASPFYFMLTIILFIAVPKIASAIVGNTDVLSQSMSGPITTVATTLVSAFKKLGGKK